MLAEFRAMVTKRKMLRKTTDGADVKREYHQIFLVIYTWDLDYNILSFNI